MTDPGTRPLVIIGAGGHGRETLDIVEAINDAATDGHQPWHFVGFAADTADTELLSRRHAPWIGPIAQAIVRFPTACFVIGIGHSATRQRIDQQLRDTDWHAVTLVHPQATVGADVRLGQGVVVAAGARVTTNVTLGRHTQVNVNAVVSHDCVVADFVTFSPGTLINGTNRIDEGAFFGTGAIVTPGHTIGAWAIVGAGAVVVADVPANSTVKGVPAR